ncbi:DUF4105 domain-containing protein [Sphingobacteriales bacterium UPWRP_1]|nr:hypothetical protein B6N25_07495 [Sphingobacteriales bacterium TSM_CSS]PSJ78733.1 DUF4105 domain-containing protein [Sphingobacteriales bacterium UPWRP_1]
MRQKSRYLLLFPILLLLATVPNVNAQTLQLSPQAEVSLLTCAPGNEVYSYFGHCALRINDPANNYDKVFNYGTFNFSEPNFYFKFIKGKLNYYLSVAPFSRFAPEYESENRWVYEQILQLTPAQKQNLADLLLTNALPENRAYLYDFFYDNCATRPRDIIEKSLQGKVTFADTLNGKTLSFRQLIDPYIKKNEWVDFGIDLILGYPADHKATTYQYMFLPDYLMNAFADAQITDSLGKSIPLVKNTLQVVNAQLPPAPKNLFNPYLAFGLLLAMGLLVTLFQVKRKKFSAIFDLILFGITGLLGIILLLLWFATNHKELAFNMNLIWAFPLHLPAALLLLKSNAPKWVGVYFGIFSVVCIILLVFWLWLPQQLHHSLIFLVSLMALRSALLYKAYLASLKTIPA